MRYVVDNLADAKSVHVSWQRSSVAEQTAHNRQVTGSNPVAATLSMEKFTPKAPIDFSSVSELLKRNASRYPDKAAVITVNPHTLESFSINYTELKELVFKTAAWLLSLGIKKGDKYAILMHNTAEILIFELAGSLIGATSVPLDSKRDTVDRTLFKIEQTNAKALFETVGDEGLEDLEQIKKTKPTLKIFSWSSFEEFKKLLPQDFSENFKDNLDSHYVILYTSGTTNMPKGVPLKISSCLLNAKGIADWQNFQEDEIFNLVLPLHHINSTIFCLAILITGGTIIMNTAYSVSGFWKIVDKFKCTNSSIVPTILHDLLAREKEFFEGNFDIASLKRICIGSAPVLPEQTMRFIETFNIKVIQGYGQTETALRVTGVPVDLSEEDFKKMVKLNSIGLELKNCQVAILDQKNRPMKEGEEGELCISGPVLGDGYLNDSDATAFSFKDEWFHSGDLGFYRNMEVRMENGSKIQGKFFFIVGRIKEIIIKGGVNISPSAIEDILHKNLKGISEVSAVGIPDERMGEEIAVVIVLKEGTSKKEILEKFEDHRLNLKELSDYETPKRIFFFESLPKTSTGKIQRVEIKKQIGEKIKNGLNTSIYIRAIKPGEDNILKQVTDINNSRFQGLPAPVDEFKQRSKNGLLLGAFKETGEVIGSISCLRIGEPEIKSFKTWNEASGSGSLENNNPKGDSLLCLAISVAGRPLEKKKTLGNKKHLAKLAKKEIENYVNLGVDYVLNFHQKSKAGIDGAKIFKILENGRAEDKDSLGFNVIVKYPKISKGTKLTHNLNASASIKLIEYVLNYAKEQGIENVYAFSRPAGFRDYLNSKI